MKRRWLLLFNAVSFTVASVFFALAALRARFDGLPLGFTVPFAAGYWWHWRVTRPPKPRPDYARIAELEAELFPPCSHAGGVWVWSERRGKLWYCSACPPPDFAPNVKDVEALLSKLEGTFAPIRKPQPPPGRGASSPTRRQ